MIPPHLEYPTSEDRSLRTALETVLRVETRDMGPNELAGIFLNENHLSHARILARRKRKSDITMGQGMRACLIENLEPSEKFVINGSQRPLRLSYVHNVITGYFTTRGYHPTTGRLGWNVRTYAQEDPETNVSVISSSNKDRREIYVVVVPNCAEKILRLSEGSFSQPSVLQDP